MYSGWEVPDSQLKQQGVKCIRHDRQSSLANKRKGLKNSVSIKEYMNYKKKKSQHTKFLPFPASFSLAQRSFYCLHKKQL